MIIKVILTIIFLVVMVGVGLYSRKQASSVDGFVLGGRAVGPWLTAFAYGTSYFSAVVFVGYATDCLLRGLAWATPSLVRCWHGWCWGVAQS